jgi:hypothetical protein
MPGWKPVGCTVAGRPTGGTNAASHDRRHDGDQHQDQEDDDDVHALTRPHHRIQDQDEAMGSGVSILSSVSKAVSLPSFGPLRFALPEGPWIPS